MTTDTEKKRLLDYFPGGREGIRKRAGDMIRRKLEEMTFVDIVRISDALKIDLQFFRDISKGDYGGIDSKVLEKVQPGFAYSLPEILGRPDFPKEVYTPSVVGSIYREFDS